MYRVLWLLGISVLALLVVGFVVLASAGSVNGGRFFGDKDANLFLIRQGQWLLISLPCLWAAAKFDYHRWREYPWLTIALYVVVIALMVAVLFGAETKGSRRWIEFGPLRLQPSELAKFATVVVSAAYLDRRGWMLGKFWKGAVRAAFIVALPLALAVKEPDFGAAVVIGLVGCSLFLISGMRWMHLFTFFVVGGCLVGGMVAMNANRMNRINAWVRSAMHAGPSGEQLIELEKSADQAMAATRSLADVDGHSSAKLVTSARQTLALTRKLSYAKNAKLDKKVDEYEDGLRGLMERELPVAGSAAVSVKAVLTEIKTRNRSREKQRAAAHQLEQALVAIRRGGIMGVGFNESMQKHKYLPEAHTDFIFAIGAEEWGLFFSGMVVLLFSTLFICGMMISFNAPDRLGRLLAFGMTFLVVFQALFNIGVVTGCLPTKGIALPFISYGGTNLLTAMIEIGVIFNVGKQIGLQSPRPRSKISPVFSTQGVPNNVTCL